MITFYHTTIIKYICQVINNIILSITAQDRTIITTVRLCGFIHILFVAVFVGEFFLVVSGFFTVNSSNSFLELEI